MIPDTDSENNDVDRRPTTSIGPQTITKEASLKPFTTTWYTITDGSLLLLKSIEDPKRYSKLKKKIWFVRCTEECSGFMPPQNMKSMVELSSLQVGIVELPDINGFGIFFTTPMPNDQRSCYLEFLWTMQQPSRHGDGTSSRCGIKDRDLKVGSAIVKYLMSFYDRIFAEVFYLAIPFYLKCGFRLSKQQEIGMSTSSATWRRGDRSETRRAFIETNNLTMNIVDMHWAKEDEDVTDNPVLRAQCETDRDSAVCGSANHTLAVTANLEILQLGPQPHPWSLLAAYNNQ